jgi:L,D-transpeptidase YcbB
VKVRIARVAWIVAFAIVGCRQLPADPVIEITPFLSGNSPYARGATEVYSRRNGEPLWSSAGEVRREADDLLARLRTLDREGLDPQEYGLAALQRLRANVEVDEENRARVLGELDVRLTEAFLHLLDHQWHGRIDKNQSKPREVAQDELHAVVDALSLWAREVRLNEAVERLYPDRAGYRELVKALDPLRELVRAGGWPDVEKGKDLAIGAVDPRVRQVRARLAAEKLIEQADGSDELDEELAEAVRRFQKRYRLPETGEVDEQTIAAMNVSAQDRLLQAELNLERRRWVALDADLGRRVRVNIPRFELEVLEDGRPFETMPVIVGRRDRQTPELAATITAVTVNPTWNVPPELMRDEVLPKIKNDPQAAASRGFSVKVEDVDPQGPVDPLAVDWEGVGPDDVVQVRQKPGPYNALGRVKIEMPNKKQIYLHDTPQRSLFERRTRTFSAGCIRVAKPVELAKILLDHDAAAVEKLDLLLETSHTMGLRVPKRVPVELVYWTVWVDGGELYFAPDIYGRDAKLMKTLRSLEAEEAIALAR